MTYAVETEPGIQSIVYRLTNEPWHSRPPRSGKRAVLYVAHLSSDSELREEPLIREVIESEPDAAFYLRWQVTTLPGTAVPARFTSHMATTISTPSTALALDRPYLGQKTFDVLRVLNWMTSVGHTEVHLIGLGWGALSATFAASLHDAVVQVTLKNSLTSYAGSRKANTTTGHWQLCYPMS
ncbi:MAG: hypothetical protein R3C05_06335 [Pirellulaceae bacterium]